MPSVRTLAHHIPVYRTETQVRRTDHSVGKKSAGWSHSNTLRAVVFTPRERNCQSLVRELSRLRTHTSTHKPQQGCTMKQSGEESCAPAGGQNQTADGRILRHGHAGYHRRCARTDGTTASGLPLVARRPKHRVSTSRSLASAQKTGVGPRLKFIKPPHNGKTTSHMRNLKGKCKTQQKQKQERAAGALLADVENLLGTTAGYKLPRILLHHTGISPE